MKRPWILPRFSYGRSTARRSTARRTPVRSRVLLLIAAVLGGAAALTAVLGAAVLGAFLGLRRAGAWLTVDDPPAPADAIVVLASGLSRTQRGVALYHAGHAPLVVFSNASYKNMAVACSSAQISVADAQALGLPDDAVLVAPLAESTRDEALNLRDLAAARGWNSLIVVTDPLHTRRARQTFRALLPGVRIAASAADYPYYDIHRWWATEQGFIGVFTEALKLAYYWISYGIPPI